MPFRFLLLSGLFLFAPENDLPALHVTASDETCRESQCRDSIGFIVDFEVCEILAEKFQMSKARKGTVTIEGVEKEIPFFFVHIDASFAGELVPRDSTIDKDPLEGFIEVKVKNGRVDSEDWHLSDNVMRLLTQDCERKAARQ